MYASIHAWCLHSCILKVSVASEFMIYLLCLCMPAFMYLIIINQPAWLYSCIISAAFVYDLCACIWAIPRQINHFWHFLGQTISDFAQILNVNSHPWKKQLCQILEKSVKYFLSYGPQEKCDPKNRAWPLRRVILWSITPVIIELGTGKVS